MYSPENELDGNEYKISMTRGRRGAETGNTDPQQESKSGWSKPPVFQTEEPEPSETPSKDHENVSRTPPFFEVEPAHKDPILAPIAPVPKKKWGRWLAAGITAILLIICPLLWCGIHHIQGDRLLEENDFEAAIENYGKDFLFGEEEVASAIYSAGQFHFRNGDYDTAASYFARLGDEAHQEWSDCIYAQGVVLANKKDLEAAIDMLSQIQEESRASAKIDRCHLAIAESYLEQKQYTQAEAEAQKIKNRDMEELPEVYDEIYFRQGVDAFTQKDYQTAGTFFAKCTEHSVGTGYANVYERIAQQDYYEAAQYIQKMSQEGSEEFGRHAWEQMLEETIALPTQLEPRLNLEAALHLLGTSDRYTVEDMEEEIGYAETASWEVSYTMRGPYVFLDTMIYVPESDNCFLSSPEEIESLCATSETGKILILRKQKDYTTEQTYTTVAFDLMDTLPSEYYPSQLSEVQYIVLLEYGYFVNGSYVGGKKALKENAKVTTKDLAADKIIYNSYTKNGPATLNTVYFYGDGPEYHTSGVPEMKEYIYKAICAAMP